MSSEFFFFFLGGGGGVVLKQYACLRRDSGKISYCHLYSLHPFLIDLIDEQ